MEALYNFLIYLYYFAVKVASCFNPKAKFWINGRKYWHDKLKKQINSEDKWIWIHCASLGEFEDCAVVISALRTDHPNSKILLTFFSPTGMNATLNQNIADHVTYLPLDTKANAKAFMNLVKPKLILFSRSDLWYNFLSEIDKRDIPIFLISALVNPASNFIKWPQKILYKKCYNVFTQIYCQNIETKELLEKHFENRKCTVTGNSRIDRIYQSFNNKDYPAVSQFVGDSFCVIAGSCLPVDEQMLLKTIEQLKTLNIKWILVPHEINEKHINEQIDNNKSTFIRFLNIKAQTKKHTILYIDFVGGLKHLYKYGNLAVIGGGFNKIGIHNIIEPTLHGLPTTFGPNHRGYPEALELLNLNFSTIHHNQIELQKIIEQHYHNQLTETTRNNIKQYVLINLGASEKIVTDINARMKV